MFRPVGKTSKSPRDWRTSNSSYGGFVQRGRRGPHGWLFRNSRSNIYQGSPRIFGHPTTGRSNQPNFYKAWSMERAAKWTKVPPAGSHSNAKAKTPPKSANDKTGDELNIKTILRKSVGQNGQGDAVSNKENVEINNNDRNVINENITDSKTDKAIRDTLINSNKSTSGSKGQGYQTLRGNDSRQVAECIIHFRSPKKTLPSSVNISTPPRENLTRNGHVPVPPPSVRPTSAPMRYSARPPPSASPALGQANENGQQSMRRVNFRSRTPTPRVFSANNRIPVPDLSNPVVVVASLPPTSPPPFTEYSYMCNTGRQTEVMSSHQEAEQSSALSNKSVAQQVISDSNNGSAMLQRHSAQSQHNHNYARADSSSVHSKTAYNNIVAVKGISDPSLNLALNISAAEIHPDRPSSRASSRPASASRAPSVRPASTGRVYTGVINNGRPASAGMVQYREKQIRAEPQNSGTIVIGGQVNHNQGEIVTTVREEKITTTRNVEVISRQESRNGAAAGMVENRVMTSSTEESRSQSRETKARMLNSSHTNVMHQNWIN